ncbi:MAG: OmpA family protein [Desulfobulbaceae bacterium]|jgi:peptidoglycan-associated lipoprotein|nr:OmpA family protein [Desulfobulbaceae bacterium]
MSAPITRFVVVSLLAVCLAMGLSACGKKTLIPPETSGAGAAGADSNYPAADRYNEGNLPPEGKLDDIFTDEKGGGGSGAAGGHDSAMGQSDEYKRVHGRCSEGFSPVFFGYDSASISASMRDRMEANAAWLNSNPQAHVVIEGNSDSRGTNEYNLALGERRAQGAKEYLINLGIDAGRIRTVSLGEERPLFEGMSEDDMAQNRRDDFIAE